MRCEERCRRVRNEGGGVRDGRLEETVMNDGRSSDGTRQVMKGVGHEQMGSLSGRMWLQTVASLGLRQQELVPLGKGIENGVRGANW